MISIIMPSFNPNIKNLNNTLSSIFLNHSHFEVILILQNISQKKKDDIIDLFKDEDRLKIILDNGIGISRARNLGIRNSIGNWILLLDDDVFIEKYLLDRLAIRLNDSNKLMYYGNSKIFDSNEHYVRFYITKENLSIWSYNRVCSIALIFNRLFFDKVGYFDEQLGSGTIFGSSEESDLVIRALLQGVSIPYLEEYTVFHERADHSLSKIEKYAMGSGALYKKFLLSMDIKLYTKLIADIILRILFLFTLKKKRYLFLRGFIKGFINYER